MKTYKKQSRRLGILMALLCTLLVVGKAQSDSSLTYLENKQITLETNSGKCIDLQAGNTANGNTIQLWNCATNNSNQRWNFTGRQIRITKQPGKCLSIGADDAIDGADIQIRDCDVSDRRQQWVFNLLTGGFHSGADAQKCLGLEKNTTDNGNQLQLMGCNGDWLQRWQVGDRTRIAEMPSTSPMLLTHPLEQRLEIDQIAGTNPGNGTNVQMISSSDRSIRYAWLLNGNPRARLELTVNGKASGKCLNLAGGLTDNGNNVDLSDCRSDNNNQIWIFDGLTGRIRSGRDVNKVLDIEGDDPTAKSANVRIWDSDIQLQQQSFTLTFDNSTVVIPK